MISIILPTYNRSEYLGISLETIVIARKKVPLQVIVIDDGSDCMADNEKIVESYSGSLYIKYIQLEKNSGTVSIPRNIGISWADGEVLAPMDDDCWPTEHKFDALYDLLMESDDNVMAFGQREVFNKDLNGDYIYNCTVSCEEYQKTKKAVGIDNGQFIYRRSVYDHIKPVFAINACDWETYKLFADLGNFAYLKKPVCQYVWHGGNISMLSKNKRVKPLSILGEYLEYFKDGKFKNECKNIADSQGS